MSKASLPVKELSLWHATDLRSRYPTLEHDMETDVAIVGGGISGLTLGYLLKKSGMRVVILEKDLLASGSTGKTTGKVTSQHNLIYDKLRSSLGDKVAASYGQANQQALEKIRRIVKQEHIACDWQDDDNYVYTTDQNQVEKFQSEAKAARSYGLPATFETSSTLPFGIAAAVKFAGQGKLNGRKYVIGLASIVNGAGSYVFENSRAVGIRDGDPGPVRTAKGTVRAKHIVVMTKVPTFPLIARIGYGLLEYPQFSYLVAGVPKTNFRGMYISPDPGHYSILPFTTGGKNYVLVGGQNHIPGTKFNFKTRHQRLADYAHEHFGVETIDYRWKAWDYLPYDNVLLAGKLYPWSKHLYTSTGFMKWGLTNTMVGAQIIHDRITGRDNPWKRTFNTLRSGPIKAIPKALIARR